MDAEFILQTKLRFTGDAPITSKDRQTIITNLENVIVDAANMGTLSDMTDWGLETQDTQASFLPSEFSTMREILTHATHCYAIRLNKAKLLRRYQVYVVRGNLLTPLMPAGGDKKKDPLLRGMIESRHSELPKFHWLFKGGNYSAVGTIREVLQEVNPQLRLWALGGWLPETT